MEPSLELPITLPLPVEPVEAEPGTCALSSISHHKHILELFPCNIGFKTSKFLVTNITRRCSSVSTSGLQHKLYSHVNYTVGHCTVLKSLTGGHSNSARPSTPPVVPTPVDSLKNMRCVVGNNVHITTTYPLYTAKVLLMVGLSWQVRGTKISQSTVLCQDGQS